MPETRITSIENIRYPLEKRKGLDAIDSSLDLYLPFGKRRKGLLLYVHGDWWRYRDPYGRLEFKENIVPVIAEHGYAAVSIGFRQYPHTPLAQVEDVKQALAWLKRNSRKYRIDPEKIMLLGHSSGAHLVALTALSRHKRNEVRPAAIVGTSGIYDFSLLPNEASELVESVMGGTQSKKPRVYERTQPVNQVKKVRTPFLLLDAKNDEVILRPDALETHGKRFARLLTAKGTQVEHHILPGDHNSVIRSDLAWDHVYAFMRRVFE